MEELGQKNHYGALQKKFILVTPSKHPPVLYIVIYCIGFFHDGTKLQNLRLSIPCLLYNCGILVYNSVVLYKYLVFLCCSNMLCVLSPGLEMFV